MEDPQQFALRGHSTTDALLFMLQAIYEEVDCAHLGSLTSRKALI